MFEGALLEKYDEAFVITQDSDFAPALSMIRRLRPNIKLKVLTPPNIYPSRELVRIAKKEASIKEVHLMKAMFPSGIVDENGSIIVEHRP